VLVIVSPTTPWKRAWDGQRWLKMCESFQSAATGATAVITFARVSRPRPASRPTRLEATAIISASGNPPPSVPPVIMALFIGAPPA
jgi:hypothetical protein